MSKKIVSMVLVCLMLITMGALLSSCGESLDYIATVKAWKPFGSKGISATYGEVVSKYVSSTEWSKSIIEDGQAAVNGQGTVSVKGKVTNVDGETADIRLIVRITPKTDDTVSMKMLSASLAGENANEAEAEELVTMMFEAYDSGADSLAEYFE